MTLRELRTEKGLTQIACAKYLKIPHRTYCRYEANERKIDRIKYEYMVQMLNEYNRLDEEHGILTIQQIKEICKKYLKITRLSIAIYLAPMQKIRRQNIVMLIC